MEKTYFSSLDSDSRTELTWNYGEIITAVETKDSYVSLFRLDNFYVEIIVNKLKSTLENVKLQDDPNELYEYIRELDISKLLV